MIGPLKPPPKSCRNGHLDSFFAEERHASRCDGWYWRCRDCKRRSDQRRADEKRVGSRPGCRRWYEVEERLDFWRMFHSERMARAYAADDLGMSVEAVNVHCGRHGQGRNVKAA